MTAPVDSGFDQNSATRSVRRSGYRQHCHYCFFVSFPVRSDPDPYASYRGHASFVPMYYLGVSSNIMSLGGIALAIGVLVDAAIVMVEMAIVTSPSGRVKAREKPSRNPSAGRFSLTVRSRSAPHWFFSLIIIVVSFLPVFLLEAQEGRMFRPLAWTKTLAVGFSSVLAITLVPVLMVMFIKGRLRPDRRIRFPMDTSLISAGSSPLPEVPKDNAARESAVSRGHVSLGLRIGSQFNASALRRIGALYATALPGILYAGSHSSSHRIVCCNLSRG